MTSNAGAELLKPETASLGFAAKAETLSDGYKDAKKRVLDEVKRRFKPEFLNRIDEMIVFQSLGQDELAKIVDILLRDVKGRLAEKGMKLEISPAAKAMLVARGTDFKFGARPLKRAIQKLVEDEIAERLLARKFKADDTIYVKKANGRLDFVKKGILSKKKVCISGKAAE
jgi:ATP-dependent Clp protease ATP-binding subunit ClpC